MQCTCMEVDTTTDKRGGFKGALHPCSWGIMYRDLGDAAGGNTTHFTPPHTGIQKKAAIELGDSGTGRV